MIQSYLGYKTRIWPKIIRDWANFSGFFRCLNFFKRKGSFLLIERVADPHSHTSAIGLAYTVPDLQKTIDFQALRHIDLIYLPFLFF